MNKKEEQKLLEVKKLLKTYKEVTCIDNLTVERRLTEGKRYAVIKEHSIGYLIRTDTNRAEWFSKGFFQEDWLSQMVKH